ncbi:TrbI/VirB10 family protein, partial [Xanthomonas hortorum]
PPATPTVVSAGVLIPALFLTGINSDLPGLITAQVSQPVYDTPTGRYVIIPQGSVLIGAYDSRVTFGQNRVLLVWQRLRFPNGS